MLTETRHRRDRLENAVSDLVAVRVVHRLELVQVDHRNRERTSVRNRDWKSLCEGLLEPTPIGDSGQCILE